ncbi:extracelular serine carboxypeptidase [Drechmeria coniospora]|uniref:Extracelular serine carboxypeptidase n=1 Tax=Drechmeria coniospora TaxID=98403 RepID=A0A151GUM8_DRECN|nr:extracelular serine carboxypeptidase [Drechmeria coniospora]KYK60824.1 extracelular serine carboxypeptidase [Drechmeria coniospora]ODA83520.1 hypothetical protein RJ55_02034 [Drechmeria coniospora]
MHMRGLATLVAALVVTVAGGDVFAIRRRATSASAAAEALKVEPHDASFAPKVDRYPTIKAYNLSVPIDHFQHDSRYEPHADGYFDLRYWLDTSNYKEGGPIIVLHGGEITGQRSLSVLDHGIVSMLTKATDSVGLVLEHRYYGTSFPTPNVTVENLRFLSTEQGLADIAYFATHVDLPGLENYNLTAPDTPWIIYGGSYGGALAAFARKVYPDVIWGAISSSGVLAAVDDFWQFYEAARHFAPGDCSPTQQKLVQVIDAMLFSKDGRDSDAIKQLFGLDELLDDEFAQFLSYEIGQLARVNWDPDRSSTTFADYCTTITSDTLLFQNTTYLLPEVERAITLAGYHREVEVLSTRMLNWIGHVREEVSKAHGNTSLREAASARFYEGRTDLSADWYQIWTYQTCTEWGFFMTGEGTPEDQLPMVSRAYTYDYSSILCRKLFNITSPPNVQAINKFGGFNFSFPRVALIDGAQDPWRAASPHALGLPGRVSNSSEPFILIDPAVHHWDKNGLKADKAKLGLPPNHVVEVQAMEVDILKAWLEEFDTTRRKKHKDRNLHLTWS